jgi:hypothetical protein
MEKEREARNADTNRIEIKKVLKYLCMQGYEFEGTIEGTREHPDKCSADFQKEISYTDLDGNWINDSTIKVSIQFEKRADYANIEKDANGDEVYVGQGVTFISDILDEITDTKDIKDIKDIKLEKIHNPFLEDDLPEQSEDTFNAFVENHPSLLDEKIDTDQCIYQMLQFDNYYKGSHQIMMLDVAKVMKYLSPCIYSYTSSFESVKQPNDKAIYLATLQNLLQMKVEKPPSIYLDLNHRILFEEDIHVFANLRRSGVRYMPFFVYKSDVQRLVELCR